jgi:hypothetical protein
MNSKVGFWRRRAAIEFKFAYIAQLIQVELLRHRLRLIQIQGASLPNSQLLNSFRYINNKIATAFNSTVWSRLEAKE